MPPAGKEYSLRVFHVKKGGASTCQLETNCSDCGKDSPCALREKGGSESVKSKRRWVGLGGGGFQKRPGKKEIARNPKGRRREGKSAVRRSCLSEAPRGKKH